MRQPAGDFTQDFTRPSLRWRCRRSRICGASTSPRPICGKNEQKAIRSRLQVSEPARKIGPAATRCPTAAANYSTHGATMLCGFGPPPDTLQASIDSHVFTVVYNMWSCTYFEESIWPQATSAATDLLDVHSPSLEVNLAPSVCGSLLRYYCRRCRCLRRMRFSTSCSS